MQSASIPPIEVLEAEQKFLAYLDATVDEFHELMCPIVITKSSQPRSRTYNISHGVISIDFFVAGAVSEHILHDHRKSQRKASSAQLLKHAGRIVSCTKSGKTLGWNVILADTPLEADSWQLVTTQSLHSGLHYSPPYATGPDALFRNLNCHYGSEIHIEIKKLKKKTILEILGTSIGIESATKR